MGDLLHDCLSFPEATPYVQEKDGIRRSLRCALCHKAERPPDAREFSFCDDCLRRLVGAIEQREPIDGVVLFRTYNAGARCGHADADTVLASVEWAGDTIFGNCRRCIEDEVDRRAAGVRTSG